MFVGLTSLMVCSSLAADPPKFTTNFRYDVKFADIVNTYNENQHMDVPVGLPPDQPWQCVRNGVATVEGRLRGGFACTNDGWKTVLTMVGCKINGEDSPRTAAMRLFGPRADGKPQGAPSDAGADGGASPRFGRFVDLAVTCETVAVK